LLVINASSHEHGFSDQTVDMKAATVTTAFATVNSAAIEQILAAALLADEINTLMLNSDMLA
jgi:hypothetical protein